jgi:DNA-binding NarL/FixJ family response regulator
MRGTSLENVANPVTFVSSTETGKAVGTPLSNPIPLKKPGSVRVLLIEDHVILREGLRALLDLEPDLEVVGEAESVVQGRAVADATRPGLVITDIALPGESGLSIIPSLKDELPGVRVLVLTAHCTDEYVRAALEMGADGYILKDASRSELLEGIRAVLDGRQYFSAAVTHHVVSGYLGRREAKPRQEVPVTAREKEVLKLIALAYSTKRIALRLKLSVKTVEKHRSNLMRKLELQNTAAVTLYAVRHKLVPIDVIGQPADPSADDLDEV